MITLSVINFETCAFVTFSLSWCSTDRKQNQNKNTPSAIIYNNSFFRTACRQYLEQLAARRLGGQFAHKIAWVMVVHLLQLCVRHVVYMRGSEGIKTKDIMTVM